MANSGAILGKIGIFFIPASGHTRLLNQPLYTQPRFCFKNSCLIITAKMVAIILSFFLAFQNIFSILRQLPRYIIRESNPDPLCLADLTTSVTRSAIFWSSWSQIYLQK